MADAPRYDVLLAAYVLDDYRVNGWLVIDRMDPNRPVTRPPWQPMAKHAAEATADWLNEGWNAASGDSDPVISWMDRGPRELVGWLRMLFRLRA